MLYEDVVKPFQDTGYTIITENDDYHILTGWLTDEGEVKSVTIEYKKKINSYAESRLDAKVKIKYHDFKKNKISDNEVCIGG